MTLAKTFADLRQANTQRLPLFKNKHDEPVHSQPDGSDWTDAEWLQAVIGELGEYANVRKKLQRGDYTQAEALPMMADELADVATYLDIFAFRLDIDLSTVLRLNYTPTWGTHLDRSDAEWLLAVDVHVGRCAGALLTGPVNNSHVSFEIMYAIASLNVLAARQGIDLCGAIVSKFNRVSERVGCDVKLASAEERFT